MALHRISTAVAIVLLTAGLAGTIGLPQRPAAAQSPASANCPDCRQPWWSTAHGAHLHQRPIWPMEAYSQQATASIAQALQAQVQNGELVEMTVWNHHFEEKVNDDGTRTTNLRPSGLALLHRAARRYSQRPDFLILVQTARDQEFTPDQIDTYAAELDLLDAARVAAVRDYLTKVLRRPDARVLVHDPAIVGMPSEEMTLAYLNMIHYGPRGVLLLKNNDITAAAEGERDTEREPVARTGTGSTTRPASDEGTGTTGTSGKGTAKGTSKGTGKGKSP
jgi:hypothetical protein